MEITELTVHELQDKLKKKEITLPEITKAYAKRIEEKKWVEFKQVFKARKLINPNPHKGILGIILARVCNE